MMGSTLWTIALHPLKTVELEICVRTTMLASQVCAYCGLHVLYSVIHAAHVYPNESCISVDCSRYVHVHVPRFLIYTLHYQCKIEHS